MYASGVDYQKVYREVKALTEETFTLWDENRVGFRWRNYLPNHTKRVCAACIELGKSEGGNPLELEFAATLHDITKPYDGAFFNDEKGKRLVDENGFWKNELLMPARSNLVTRLYDEFALYGSVHHISGAFIARNILERYGLSQDFIDNVCSIINAHIRPQNLTPRYFKAVYNKIESQILSDADTIDANLGHIAFFRNVHIHAYRAIQKNSVFDMERYADSLQKWVVSKQSFTDSLFTESAHRIGRQRQVRNLQICQKLIKEKEYPVTSMKYGLRGLITYLVSQTPNPNISQEMSYIRNNWVPEREKWLEVDDCNSRRELARKSLQSVIDFYHTINEESRGIK